MAIKTQPVTDSVPKINDEVAVGEDLQFQRRWWAFERWIWMLFALLVLLDLLGAFGRGPLAKKHAEAADGSMKVDYERIERFSTPSILTVSFGKQAIRDGKIQLWVSESLVKKLGNQRIVPQPAASSIGNNGILYTFPASDVPATAEFALSPASPGSAELQMQVPGSSVITLKVFIVP
ncbi:MAG: hypothetical protein JWP08_1879 [Bryobacterales bacterium]|nr:hypothetical protein [Bryobacterales bacterium]